MLSALRAGQRPLDIAKFLSVPKSTVYDIRKRYLANDGAKGSKEKPIGNNKEIIVTPERKKTSPRRGQEKNPRDDQQNQRDHQKEPPQDTAKHSQDG